MAKSEPIDDFIKFYEEFNLEDKSIFQIVYDENIYFADPFHEVSGLNNLYSYFNNMMSRVTNCKFEIGEVVRSGGKEGSAFICWKMHFSHRTLNHGKEIIVDGATHIKFKNKVTYHRDYFDSSQLLYKHIPVLGYLVKIIEGRM